MRTSTAIITDLLSRNIIGRKKVAEIAIAVMPRLIEVMKKYEGKKIFTVKGDQTAKFKVDILKAMLQGRKDLGLDNRTSIYISQGYRSLEVSFNSFVTWGKYEEDDMSDGEYYSMTLYVAELENRQILKEFYDHDQIMKPANDAMNVDIDFIKNTRRKIADLKKQIDDLNSYLPYYAKAR